MQKNNSAASLKSNEKVIEEEKQSPQANTQNRKHNPYQKEIDLIQKKLTNNKN